MHSQQQCGCARRREGDAWVSFFCTLRACRGRLRLRDLRGPKSPEDASRPRERRSLVYEISLCQFAGFICIGQSPCGRSVHVHTAPLIRSIQLSGFRAQRLRVAQKSAAACPHRSGPPCTKSVIAGSGATTPRTAVGAGSEPMCSDDPAVDPSPSAPPTHPGDPMGSGPAAPHASLRATEGVAKRTHSQSATPLLDDPARAFWDNCGRRAFLGVVTAGTSRPHGALRLARDRLRAPR